MQKEKEQEDKPSIKDKREEKLESKRDIAIAKMVHEHEKEDKEERKAEAV